MPSFLLDVLLAASLMYVTALVVAEVLFTSVEERRLPVAVRVALGHVFLLVYFAAALRLMTIQWAWGLGLGLFGVHLLSRRGRPLLDAARRVRSARRAHAAAYLAFLGGVNLFLLPLHLGGIYGPFTEGGGDVTIYADTAKLITDRQLAAYGVADVQRDLQALVTRPPLEAPPRESWGAEAFDPVVGNPPSPESAVYRVWGQQLFPSYQFSPVAQWYFLAQKTNYAVFYALLAFEYAVLLLVAAAFFRPFGRAFAVSAVILLTSSHAFVSVFYNVYMLQATSIMISLIVMYAVLRIPVLTLPGVRSIGLPFAFLFGGYYHFVTVAGPMIAMSWAEIVRSTRSSSSNLRRMTLMQLRWQPLGSASVIRLTKRVSASALAAVILLSVVVDANRSAKGIIAYAVYYVLYPLGLATAPDLNRSQFDVGSFFGVPVRIWSEEWLSFFFGALSQQHYPPFVVLPQALSDAARVSGMLGLVVLGLGFLSVAICWRDLQERGAWTAAPVTRPLDPSLGQYVVLYGIAVALVAFHHTVAQTSLYAQAKGAQNVLGVVYGVLLLLPLALLWTRRTTLPSWTTGLRIGYTALLAAFTVSLLIPRVYFAARIGASQDRSGVLEASFYGEAERIMRVDPGAFVLVEPRNNADVYLSIQPFFGARMLPTRHLVFDTRFRDEPAGADAASREPQWRVERDLRASDFITQQDAPHLWLLSASADEAGACGLCLAPRRWVWQAQRVADAAEPRIIFTAVDYQRTYSVRPRSPSGPEMGWFSYVNSGAALLALPAGAPGPQTVEVTVHPTDPSEGAALASYLERWAGQQAQPPTVTLEQSERAPGVVMTYRVPPSTDALLVPVARYEKEYLVNIRVDGQELLGATPTLSVSGGVEPGQPLEVQWSRVPTPDATDWVGLFPRGDDGRGRITFAVTGGGAEGRMALDVPASTPPGEYELRLFSRGTWQQLTASAPFDILPSSSRVMVSPDPARAGQAVTVEWSGIGRPSVDDWVGIFPAGAADESRLIHTTLPGTSSGTVQVVLPGTTAPGAYEVRLFANGTWQQLASSSFRVEP